MFRSAVTLTPLNSSHFVGNFCHPAQGGKQYEVTGVNFTDRLEVNSDVTQCGQKKKNHPVFLYAAFHSSLREHGSILAFITVG